MQKIITKIKNHALLALWIGLGAFLLVLPSCLQEKEIKKKVKEPVSVQALKVEGFDFDSFNEFAGTVQSSVSIQVSSRIVAQVQEIYVHAGALVKKDDVLVRLSDGDIQARIRQAQSNLKAAEALREEAWKDVARYRNLVERQLESRQKLEQVEAKAKSTAAAVDVAKQQIEEIKEGLKYTEIRSPINGVVVEKFVNLGDLASPNRPLLTLQDPTKIRLEVPVSEQCAGRIKIRDAVWVKISSMNLEIPTTIGEIVPALDPKSRSFIVKANLPSDLNIQPGMFGRLLFPCEPRRVIAVNRSCILSRGQLDMVFVVANDKARLRIVRLGEVQKGRPGEEKPLEEKIEILSGLVEGEWVIVNPPENLEDLDEVKILEGKKS